MNIDRELVARAMDKAGEEPINDIEWTEGTSTRVRLIKDFYLATILETLSGTDWTSQKKRAALELSDEVNLSNYYYMYNLPLDCAKPCNLVNDEDFYCEGGFLFSNTENAVLIYVKNYFTGKYTYRIVREPDTENITRYYTYNDETDEYTQATEYDMSNTYYERVDEDYNFYAQPVFDPILSEAVETRLASKIVLKLNGDNNKYQLLYSEAILAANNAVKNSAKHARNKNHGNKYWAQELGWE
ncbi:MAG: hypothetical protein J6S85_12610 [Methanobrevibacter sp.]|nr:hypothetical protein [Methanobrevibacter sp.]